MDNVLTIVMGRTGDGFFDGDHLLTYVHENDGNWRSEYFDPILQHFGIRVERRCLPFGREPCTPTQAALLQQYEE